MIESTQEFSVASIVALLQNDDAAGAERAARRRLTGDPDDKQAMVLLAIAVGMLKRPREAAELYRKLIELDPGEVSHYSNLATELREYGEVEDAERAYRQALSINPGHAPILASLGSLRWQSGDAVDARNMMLEALRLDPNLPEARIYGAMACHECADADTARSLIEDCNRWPYLGPTLEANLATVLMQLERGNDAEARLRRLMERPEGQGIARLRLAGQLERVNRLDEAQALLDEAIVDPTDRDEEVSLRAALAARNGDHAQAIGYYRSMLDAASDGVTKAPQWFALAKAYDACKDAKGAMEALSTAHALQMRHAGRLVPNLLAPVANPLSIIDYPVDADSHKLWKVDANAPSVQASPIFVVGFPRSGTTLLEQMLDAHPGLRSMDERAFLQNVIARMQSSGRLRYPDDLDQLDGAALDELRATYWECVEEVIRLEAGERLVDKNPLNLLRLPIIHRIFPNARIVLALRHPCDVILSNYMQAFRAPGFQVLCSSLDRLARGYANAMEFWVRHVAVFEPAVLELRYEDLLDDVTTQTGRIAAHLELSDAAALERFQEHARAKGYISTPSYAQVIQPLNTKAVGRWQRYREYLEPVLPRLEPAMQRWGYTA